MIGIACTDSDSSGWISGNLAWFLAGTAVFALLVAGLLTGYLSGVRGATSGLVNGLTAVNSRLGAGIAEGSNSIGGPIGQAGGGVTAENFVWATFWSLLIGAIVAALGGIAGGAAKRQIKTADNTVRDTDDDHRTYPVEPATSVHSEPFAARHSTPGTTRD